MNKELCPTSLAEQEYDRQNVLNNSGFTIEAVNKRVEVFELAGKLLKNESFRLKSWWSEHLISYDGLLDDVYQHDLYADACKALTAKSNPEPLQKLYRRCAKYMIARSLYDHDTAIRLGFEP